MAERGIALALIGIVAVIAVVGFVLLYSGALSGDVVLPGAPKIYPGKVVKGLTGPGFQYAGEGAYVSSQRGSCARGEFFSQSPQGYGYQCRKAGVRTEAYQRSRGFYGVEYTPYQTFTVQGFCCTLPNVRAETRYSR